MKKWCQGQLIISYLTPFLVAGCAALLPGDDAALSLARAEAAFAAQSVREDMRTAFIAHFARDGVFVRNGWANARDYLAPRPAPPIVLDWRPAFVVVSDSGELGLSTGPWKLTSRERPGDPPEVGQFASVWRRDAGGTWQVIVDLGITHRDASTWDAPLRARRVAAAGRPATAFADTEARFAAASASGGLRAAYRAHAADEMSLLRQGSAPVVGRDAALASAALGDDRVEWTVEQGEASRAGDLAYARGRYAAAAAPARTLGEFLRVWQVERGEWRIVLDVTNPR
jgi:ketosteroid isomerase-like protein